MSLRKYEMQLYSTFSDDKLFDLLKSGDDLAFAEIYNRYWNRMLTVAVNKIGNLADAEEIVQDIFISVWKRRKTLELSSTFNNYFAVAVKYQVIKLLSKRSNQKKYIDTISNKHSLLDNSTQELLDFEALKKQLSALVADLPEKCQLVYKLSRDEGMSQKQIATELGVAEKTVEAHLGKAIKLLRKNLHPFLLALI